MHDPFNSMSQLANGIKVCRFSEHPFSCLAILLDATLKAACPTLKAPVPNPTSGEIPVKSTHACFPPTHPYTITSARRSVNLSSSGPDNKFTGASFFTDTVAVVVTLRTLIFRENANTVVAETSKTFLLHQILRLQTTI